mmetsp:Transcript_29068/g.61691  ORF Transcript_29068/g.61691 Transcript_29068/m.61691 type:complete len:303 (-) Transcript_29068:543-1451(-)
MIPRLTAGVQLSFLLDDLVQQRPVGGVSPREGGIDGTGAGVVAARPASPATPTALVQRRDLPRGDAMLQFLVDAGDDGGQLAVGHARVVGVGRAVAGVVSHRSDRGDPGPATVAVVRAEVFVGQRKLRHVALRGVHVDVGIVFLLGAHDPDGRTSVAFRFPQTRTLPRRSGRRVSAIFVLASNHSFIAFRFPQTIIVASAMMALLVGDDVNGALGLPSKDGGGGLPRLFAGGGGAAAGLVRRAVGRRARERRRRWQDGSGAMELFHLQPFSEPGRVGLMRHGAAGFGRFIGSFLLRIRLRKQ